MSRRSVHICRTAVVTCVKCSQNILTAVDVLELLKRHFPGRDPSSRRNLTLIRSISSTVTATSIVTAPAIKSLVGVKLDHFRVLWSHNPILNERIVGKVTLSQRRIVWAINDLGCAWVFEKKTFSKSHMHDKSPYRQEDIAGGSQPNVVWVLTVTTQWRMPSFVAFGSRGWLSAEWKLGASHTKATRPMPHCWHYR